jgi:hypothetical protein
MLEFSLKRRLAAMEDQLTEICDILLEPERARRARIMEALTDLCSPGRKYLLDKSGKLQKAE